MRADRLRQVDARGGPSGRSPGYSGGLPRPLQPDEGSRDRQRTQASVHCYDSITSIGLNLGKLILLASFCNAIVLYISIAVMEYCYHVCEYVS